MASEAAPPDSENQQPHRRLRIFLCHASNDKEQAHNLYERLRKVGTEPWHEEENVVGGQTVEEEKQKAVRRTDVVIICLSKQSMTEAGTLRKEIHDVLDVADKQPEGSIALIPVKLEECDIPQQLNNVRWIPYYTGEPGFERLMRALHFQADKLGITIRPIEPQVVLLLHGIRTQATWQGMVCRHLELPDAIEVLSIRFGFLNAFRFWFPFFTRKHAINWIHEQIRSTIHTHSNGKKLSIIAHSFGTYAISQIIEHDPNLDIYRLILCGSIIKSDFKWAKVRHQIHNRIINECGARDMWPILAQSTSWGYGDSGTFGFGDPASVENRYHDHAHSDYFDPKFVDTFWMPFIRYGEIVRLEGDRPPVPWWKSALSILPLKYLIVLLLAYVVYLTGASLLPKVSPRPIVPVVPSPLPKVSASPTVPVVSSSTATSFLSCNHMTDAVKVKVIIASFKRSSDVPPSNLEERISDTINKNQIEGLSICRVGKEVVNHSEAQLLAEDYHSDLVIWGRMDRSIYEYEVDLTSTQGRGAGSTQPPPRPGDNEYQFALQEQQVVDLLTKFSLSQIFCLKNNLPEARKVLRDALSHSQEGGGTQVAEAYFFLGLLYDQGCPKSDPAQQDLNEAILNYTKAITSDTALYKAYLNRGDAYKSLGKIKEAKNT